MGGAVTKDDLASVRTTASMDIFKICLAWHQTPMTKNSVLTRPLVLDVQLPVLRENLRLCTLSLWQA